MKNITQELGFRLIVTFFIIASITVFISGIVVYKMSEDSIKDEALLMTRDLVSDICVELGEDPDLQYIFDTLMKYKVHKSGSVWLMDNRGVLLFHPDPEYRPYVEDEKSLSNVIIELQWAEPRVESSYKVKIKDIIKDYEEGFGKYKQLGEEKVIAFKVIKEKGWLIGIDEPIRTAYSDLASIKKYIIYTCLGIAIMIMVSIWVAVRKVIKPYYREVEEMNVSLGKANKQLNIANFKLESSNKNLTKLYEISIAMQESLDLEETLDLIISGAHEVLELDRIIILLPNEDKSMLECKAAVGNLDEPLRKIKVPISEESGFLAKAYLEGEVIHFDGSKDIPEAYKLKPPYSKIKSLRSKVFAIIPLIVKDRPVGIISVDNRFRKEPIPEAILKLLEIFANQAAAAVENAKLYEELREKIRELDNKVDQLAILNQISNSMQKIVHKDQMLSFILRGIKESLEFDRIVLCLVNEEEGIIEGELSVGVTKEDVEALRIPLTEEGNLLVATALQKYPFSVISSDEDLVANIAKSGNKDLLVERHKKRRGPLRDVIVTVPLVFRDRALGVIAVDRYITKEPIKAEDIDLLMLFANTAGLAVERAELYEQLSEYVEDLKITDHLTNLYTHEYGHERLDEEVHRSKRAKKPLALAMLGIDYFKEYNDMCGHHIGNTTLKQIGQMIKTSIRDIDVAFRYGGGLLTIIFPITDAEGARIVTEKIRNKIEEFPFEGQEDLPNKNLTISGGIATYDPKIKTSEEFFDRAIRLLRKAEFEGRNKLYIG